MPESAHPHSGVGNAPGAESPTCRVIRLGRVPYAEARELQERLGRAIAAGDRPPTLLLLEHPHTYTFGRRGSPQDLLWGESELRRKGVEVHWIDRGGEATYHGPGQLVGYPLLRLGRPGGDGRLPAADYTGYLRRLEEMVVRAAAALGLASGQIPGQTGVWVQPDVASRCPRCPPEARRLPAKLASIGVKVDAKGITRHGFALNVHPDMSFWQGIVACGMPGAPAVALADLLEPPPGMQAVIHSVIAAFGRVFGFEMELEDAGAAP
jgi:lipoate-protein ligase B